MNFHPVVPQDTERRMVLDLSSGQIGGEKLRLKVTQVEQIFQLFPCFSETLGRFCLENEAMLLRGNAYQRTSPTSNLSSPDLLARLCFSLARVKLPELYYLQFCMYTVC